MKKAILWSVFLILVLGNLILLTVLLEGGEEVPKPPIDNCKEVPTKELFTLKKYDCGDTTVYTFQNDEGRDNWITMATQIGGVVLDKGDSWVQVRSFE